MSAFIERCDSNYAAPSSHIKIDTATDSVEVLINALNSAATMVKQQNTVLLARVIAVILLRPSATYDCANSVQASHYHTYHRQLIHERVRSKVCGLKSLYPSCYPQVEQLLVQLLVTIVIILATTPLIAPINTEKTAHKGCNPVYYALIIVVLTEKQCAVVLFQRSLSTIKIIMEVID